jgi:alanine racemase
MANKSRRTIPLLLKSLKMDKLMSREGIYLRPREVYEACQRLTRARNVLDAVASHILATHEPADTVASMAVVQVTHLKEQISEVGSYSRTSSA